MKVVRIWFFLLIAGVLSGCSMTLRPRDVRQMTTPTATPTVTAAPTAAAVSTAVTHGRNPAPSPTPFDEDGGWRVCTGMQDGALNVRFCPGVECYAFFYLREGERVRLTPGRTVDVDGGRWVQIHHPVEGWVNARYLCSGD